MAETSDFANAPIGGLLNAPATGGVSAFGSSGLIGAEPGVQESMIGQAPLTQPTPGGTATNVAQDFSKLTESATAFKDESGAGELKLSPSQRVGLSLASTAAGVIEGMQNIKFAESNAMKQLYNQALDKDSLERMRRVDNDTSSTMRNLQMLKQLKEQSIEFGRSGRQTQLRSRSEF